jgi:integrase
VKNLLITLLSGPALGRSMRKISKNTAASYFLMFKRTLKLAYKQKLLTENIGEIIESITPNETQTEYLSQKELQKLADTPCETEVLKKASLLSALTGLRFSDIKALCWSQIRQFEGHYYIQFRQEKTEKLEMLPISDIAIKLIGKQQHRQILVFTGLTYPQVDHGLPKWINDSG